MRQVCFPIYPAQAAFLDSQATTRGFCAGIGSGKSYVGAYDLLRRAKAGRLYMVIAPTYPMLRDATFRSFKSVASRFGSLVKLNKTEFHADIACFSGGTAEVLFRSGDEPDTLRGPNLSGMWLDEASLLKREAFEVGLGRLREGGETGWISATFTPKGKQHWTYEVFAGGGRGVELIRARTLDNPFLPEDYYEMVSSQYTSTLAAQELGGEWIEAGGKLFRREWFQVVDAYPADFTAAVRYWDKAGTEDGGDFSAGVLMLKREGLYYVADVRRDQWSIHQRNQAMKQAAGEDETICNGRLSIWSEQEPGSSGKESAENTARLLDGYDVHADKVTGSKEVRAQPFAAQCEAGNVRVVRGKWNAEFLDEMCLAKGTEIITMRGSIPIEDVTTEDYVATRQGWRRVLYAECTNWSAVVCQIHASNGRSLVATRNHPILVQGCGFKSAGLLRAGDGLLRFIEGPPSICIPNQRRGTSRGRLLDGTSSCITTFGNVKSDQCRPASMFTTRMKTRRTIDSTICSAFRLQIISTITGNPFASQDLRKHRASRAERCIAPSSSAGQRHAQGNAPIVGSLNWGTSISTSELVRRVATNIEAQRGAGRIARLSAPQVLSRLTGSFRQSCANGAEMNFALDRQRFGFAADVAVCAVSTLRERQPVFNLEIEGCHEYFANGILVHNCSFPGVHDDQVDAASGAYTKLARPKRRLMIPSI